MMALKESIVRLYKQGFGLDFSFSWDHTINISALKHYELYQFNQRIRPSKKNLFNIQNLHDFINILNGIGSHIYIL